MNKIIIILAFLFSLSCSAEEPPFSTSSSIPVTAPSGTPTETPSPLPAEAVAAPIPLIAIALEAQIAVPQPLEIGVSLTPRFFTRLKGYLNGGYAAYPFGSTSSFAINETSVELGARYYPTASWWGISLGLGYRNIQISTNQLSSFNVNGLVLATSAALTLSTFYLSPMLEADFRLSDSWRFGFGLGVQIAFAGAGTLNFQNSTNGTNSNNSSLLQSDSGDYYSHVALLLIPQVTLCRFSYHF